MNLQSPGETLASKLERDESRLKNSRETLALSEGAVTQGLEVRRSTRAVIVVPDSDAVAEGGFLGVQVNAEGVVVNAPVGVDSGLVASYRSGNHFSRELGLTVSGVTDGTALPGEELNAGGGETSVGSHGKDGHSGKGLVRVNKSQYRSRGLYVSVVTLEKCIMIKDSRFLARKVVQLV